MKLVTYEVYVMSPNGGGWYLYSRFSSDERDDAFELCQSIEQTERLPTKLVREVYDNDKSTNENTVIYISPKIRSSAGKRKQQKHNGTGYPSQLPSANYLSSDEYISFGKVVWLFIFILLVSFLISLVASVLVVFFLSSYTSVSDNVGGQVTFLSFIIVFVASAIPLSKRFIPWHKIKYKSEGQNQNTSIFKEKEDLEKKSFTDNFQQVVYNFFGIYQDDIEEVEEPYPFKKPSAKKESNVEKEFKNIFESNETVQDANPFTEKKIEEQKSEEDNVVDEQEQPEMKENDMGQDAIYESHKKQMIFFIKEVALRLKSESLPITAFTKFGFNLLVVGATDYLKEKSDISEDVTKKLTVDSLLLLGLQPHLAETFCEKIDSYTLNPIYLQMIHNGKSIMTDMSIQSADMPEKISTAFKDWLKPVSKEQNVITVMFTDITNSTAITQELGDEKAYDLIKTHNAIVRKALQEMSGREIKHTGDGIMASFLSAINAVQAAVLIQKLSRSYTKQNPELPLKLKVGLSTGEPIREGQDLFGSTVQIASRLCDYAKAGQILVSQEVASLNQSSSQVFTKIGEEELKGLKHPIEIYQVEYPATE